MKFEFVPPAAATAEKIRLEIPAPILTWAEEVAKANQGTKEAVLEQALQFAFDSAAKPIRVRKGK